MTTPRDDRPWTVGRLLTWTADYLGQKGADSPRLDAEVLLAYVLKWQRVQLYTHFADEVAEASRTAYRELVKRRAGGEPVAYLVGRKEFFSLPLTVDRSVLIPRPDTEVLVVEILARLKGRGPVRVLDVGTGSGCIALAVAKSVPEAHVVATDLSEPALAVARKNAEALKLADRVEFRRGDLFDAIGDLTGFDAIASNPPYIATDVIASLDRGVRDHEPHSALDGGPDGLRVVARLVEGASSRLRPGGHLLLEIGSDQEMPVRALIAARPELDLAPTIRDAANHPRVVAATRAR